MSKTVVLKVSIETNDESETEELNDFLLSFGKMVRNLTFDEDVFKDIGVTSVETTISE